MLQLDSALTLSIFIFLTVFSTLMLVFFWKKLLRKGLLNFIFRLSLVLLCQILLVATAGISINRSNEFYASWSDLLGNGVDYSSVAIPSNTTSLPDISILKNGQESVAGQLIIKEIVKGEKSGVSNVVYLILPRSTVNSIKNHQPIDLTRTKIIEFLTGYPSQPSSWLKSLGITKALAASEKANPSFSIIGVIPAVNVAGTKDLECMNFPNTGTQAETWLSTDVHSFVSNRLGISSTRWGLMGVSTGGWCSAMLSIKHENLFYGAVSIAGYYRPALAKTTEPKVKAQLDADYDFLKLETAMTGKMDMLLIASVGDIYSYRETKRFLALAHPNMNYQYLEIPTGGHNSGVWIPKFGVALDWLKKH
jgi:hypothetical protein